MRPKVIPPGTRFGRLMVRRPAGKDPRTCKSLSECVCDCGAVVVKRNNDLLTGRIVSCGCKIREQGSRMMWKRAERSNAHHMSGTPIYQCWSSMMKRCNDPRTRGYARYGGRGITVCKSWAKSFMTFYRWAMSHGYRPDLEIDRIDYNGHYRPSNCRFVDQVTQANNKSGVRIIEYQGRKMSVAQWARELDTNYGTLKAGTRRGKPLEYYDKRTSIT